MQSRMSMSEITMSEDMHEINDEYPFNIYRVLI